MAGWSVKIGPPSVAFSEINPTCWGQNWLEPEQLLKNLMFRAVYGVGN